VRAAAEAPNAPPPEPEAPKLETEITVTDLGNGVTQLRVNCTDKMAYEVEYSLNKGTSENFYIFQSGSEVTVLGIPDNQFAEAFLDALPSICPLSSIANIIIPHFSPKRLEALAKLIEARCSSGELPMLHCGNPALTPLKTALPESLLEGRDYRVTAVRNGSAIAVGPRRLRVTLTPTPRWPDLFCTFDSATETLFTSKLFSCHICTPDVFDDAGWEELNEDFRHYFECTLAASAKQAKKALKKLAGYVIGDGASANTKASYVRQLAPLHGTIVRDHTTELIREYNEWTDKQIAAAEEATVGVIYASAYGNTTAMAQAISRGIAKAGVGVESLNCEMSDPEEVKELVRRCSGFVLGSPTLGGHMPTPIQEALGAILQEARDARTKPCGVFGSFGWSGEAIDMMHSALKDGGFAFAFDPIRCKFKPTMQMLQICEESGTDLAQAVQKEKRKRSRGAAGPTSIMSSGTEQAVGRIVGSLCVVTARSEDATSAMLASWVSQASFSPPGLTVAVAKERAVESLLTPGSEFVVSVLGDGATKGPMKAMLKAFKPGEDRFQGYETLTAEKSGGIVIPEAASYVECSVLSKLDAGDHWVLYAEVTAGKVLNDSMQTAMHHRKTGTTY